MISLTEAAGSKVKGIIESKNQPSLALRVFIKGGGCSGFSYGMALDEPRQDDNVIETGGVKVVVDPMSLQYLEGAEVDYVETMMGGGFKVHNPNAASSCGCGQSFQTKDGKGSPNACGSGCGH